VETLAARLRSRSGRSVIGSLGASGGLQLLVIVSGVLVARSLGPLDRGYLALLTVIATLCAIFGTLGLPAALTYYIARDPGHARRITSSLAWVGVLQLGSVLVVQAVALAAIAASDPAHVKLAAALSLLLPPGILALHFGLAILQGQQRFTPFNILRIIPTTAYVIGVVVLYLLDLAELVPFMALWASVNLIGGFFALFFAVRGLPRNAEDDSAVSRRQMLRFGTKALLGTLSPVDVVRLDQAAVGLFLNPVALGYYVVAQALSNLPRIVATSLGMVAYPQVAAEKDRAAARRAMWRFFFVGFALSALVVGALEVMAGSLISLFFGAEFSDATRITQILLLASLFMAGRRVLTDGINGYGYPGFGTIAEVASWIILIPGLVVLLPWLGAEGVALALTIAWGASLLLLVALALFAGRAPMPSAERLAFGGTVRRLTALPGRLPPRQSLGIAGAVTLAVLGGLVAAFLPKVALVVVVALSVVLFFAFARSTLAEHARRLQRRLARPRPSELSGEKTSGDPADEGFAFPRRLYYGGVLLVGLLTLRVGGQITFSDVLFLFSFLFASAEFVLLRRRVPMKLPFLLLMGIALFSLGGLLSTFHSYEALKSIAVIARLVFLTVIWFWVGTVVLRRQEHAMKAISFWVASAAISGAAAILQLVVSSDIVPGTALQWGRATGFTLHPNDLGGLTAIAFVPALMLASRPRTAVSARVWSYLFLLLIAAGLILSGSVGALIATSVAVLVWLAFQRMSVHSLLAFAILASCVVALITLQSIRGAPNPIERLNAVTGSTAQAGGSGSVHLRVDTYRIAIERIKEDPFVGVGLDLKSVTRPYGVESWEYDVHNLIIGLWYKTGLIGLAGMLLALLALLRSGWTAIIRSRSGGESSAAVALMSSFVAFVVFSLSEPALFSRYAWIPAAFILALRAIQQESESPEPARYLREEPRPAAAFLQP
jgi:O-antigen/teichoic acid export membrane protein/O-antigen ligase